MRRRAFLATGLAAVTAGCLSDGDDPDGGDDSTAPTNGTTGFQDPDFSAERNEALPGTAPDASASRAGLAPEPEAVDAPGVDVDALPTYDQYEESVPLLPVDAAYAWYQRRDARFVDARSETAFQNSRVAGAVLSPAPDVRRGEPLPDDDPVGSWGETERIVTYCTCPHHLSGQRASELRAEGRPAFAIDEGFGEWLDREYPSASGSPQQELAAERRVSGRVDPSHAGEFVYVRDASSDQVEPGVIADDGTFDVTFHFVDVGADDEITVQTPDWSRTAPLADLTDGEIRQRV